MMKKGCLRLAYIPAGLGQPLLHEASLDSEKRLVLRIHGVVKIKVNAVGAGSPGGTIINLGHPNNFLCVTRSLY